MPPVHLPLRRVAAILSRVRSEIISRSNWAKLSSTLSISRPIDVLVLNCWVTETNDTLCRSKTSMIFEKSISERLSRSTLYTTMQSIFPASMSASRRCSAGRSMLPPEKPPSSSWSGRQTQPSDFWLAMYASPASRCASRLLNSCSRPSSVLLRV